MYIVKDFFILGLKYRKQGMDKMKNVKIYDETHRKMCIKASELQVKKSDLAAALINCGLTLNENKIRKLIDELQTTEAEKAD